MNTLDTHLLGSRKIREFLSRFSESQWHRVIKASVVMGIQELERTNKTSLISVAALEDIVVQNESVISTQSMREIKPSAKDKVLNKAVFGQPNSARASSVPPKFSENRYKTEDPRGIKPSQKWRYSEPSQFQRQGQRAVNRQREPSVLATKDDIQQRSKSLNPLIYPDWWGDGQEVTPKPQIINQTQFKESSLDKRIQSAKEEANKLDKMMASFQRVPNHQINVVQQNIPAQQNERMHSQSSNGSLPPCETYYHQQAPSTRQSVEASNYPNSFRQKATEEQVQIPVQQQQPRSKKRERKVGKENTKPNQKESGLIMQHSPPKNERQKKKKAQQANQQQVTAQTQIHQNQAFYSKMKEEESHKNKKLPTYLKKVESRIKREVCHDRKNTNTSKTSSDLEIFVSEPQKNYKKQNKDLESQGTPQVITVDNRRPSTNSQHINVASIANEFLNSPFMTQFSEGDQSDANIKTVGKSTVVNNNPLSFINNQSVDYPRYQGNVERTFTSDYFPYGGPGGLNTLPPQIMETQYYMQQQTNYQTKSPNIEAYNQMSKQNVSNVFATRKQSEGFQSHVFNYGQLQTRQGPISEEVLSEDNGLSPGQSHITKFFRQESVGEASYDEESSSSFSNFTPGSSMKKMNKDELNFQAKQVVGQPQPIKRPTDFENVQRVVQQEQQYNGDSSSSCSSSDVEDNYEGRNINPNDVSSSSQSYLTSEQSQYLTGGRNSDILLTDRRRMESKKSVSLDKDQLEYPPQSFGPGGQIPPTFSFHEGKQKLTESAFDESSSDQSTQQNDMSQKGTE